MVQQISLVSHAATAELGSATPPTVPWQTPHSAPGSSSEVEEWPSRHLECMGPRHLVDFLYSVLVAELHRVKRALTARDFETTTGTILEALDVVDELVLTLDCDVGGDFAKDVASLYALVVRELVAINITSDAERLNSAIYLVEGVQSMWTTITSDPDASGTEPEWAFT